MMLDAGIVAVSPSSVYRVLKYAGLLGKWNSKASLKRERIQRAEKVAPSSTCHGCEAPEGPGLDSHRNILYQGGLKIPAISNYYSGEYLCYKFCFTFFTLCAPFRR